MKAIFLEGAHNTGKTTTCRLLFRNLITQGGELQWFQKINDKDFGCLLQFGGRKITIASSGDMSSGVSDAFWKSERDRNDIHIGCCRPEHKHPRQIVEQFPGSHVILKSLATDADNDRVLQEVMILLSDDKNA